MRLVADHQIKMSAGEQLALLVLDRVDAVHHGLIGREYAVGGVVVLFLAEIGHRQIGQQVHEAALGLRDQRVSVSQKQNILHPAVLQQYIAQGDDRSGLARAGGHDQQRFAAVAAAKGITDGLDGALLIVSSGDIAVHHDIFEACPHGAQIEHLFQIALGVDGCHFALGIRAVIHTGLKAVGQEDGGAAAVFIFQNVGVQFRLLAAPGHIHTGALGLDDGKGPVAVVIQHIVGKAHLALVGHTGQLHLVDPVLALCPACIHQHGVDVDLSSLVFGKIQRLGHIGLLLLGAAGGQFGLEGLVFRHDAVEVGIAPDLHHRLAVPAHQSGVKLARGVLPSVAAGHEVEEDVEVFQTQHSLLAGDFPAGMGGVVAHAADEVHALPEVAAHDIPEGLGAHEADQIVLPGHDQIAVHGIHPFDGKLHGAAAVEDGGRGVNM